VAEEEGVVRSKGRKGGGGGARHEVSRNGAGDFLTRIKMDSAHLMERVPRPRKREKERENE
jgi:hypothetical protein